MSLRIAVILVAVCTVSPSRALAQGPSSDFAGVASRVNAGDTVSVTDDANRTVTGRLVRISESGLVVIVGGEPLEMDAVRVQRISRQVHRTTEGALLGLAFGFGQGAWWASRQGCSYTCFGKPAGELMIGAVFGAGGAALGAAVGRAVHSQRVIFDRNQTAAPR